MGGALLEGWLKAGFTPADIAVVEPAEAARAVFAPRGVGVVPAPTDLADTLRPAAVVLAVKPQAMDGVLPSYRRFAEHAVFVSIAAGRTLSFLARHLGEEAALVRAMPNTPAAIGVGITVAVANDHVSEGQRALAERLLAAGGTVLWVENEVPMDAVTAVSGSGPAYVFYLTECLAAAGEAAGLPSALARQLARETVTGSAALLAREREKSPADLRREVTSPGGTTEAALRVLTGEGGRSGAASLEGLLAEAVRAAARRSRELSGDG